MIKPFKVMNAWQVFCLNPRPIHVTVLHAEGGLGVKVRTKMIQVHEWIALLILYLVTVLSKKSIKFTGNVTQTKSLIFCIATQYSRRGHGGAWCWHCFILGWGDGVNWFTSNCKLMATFSLGVLITIMLLLLLLNFQSTFVVVKLPVLH